MSTDREDGYKVYTPSVLRLYDLLVLQISNSMIWKCPTRQMIDWYDDHVSNEHLDIGVGTGYLLNRCHFPSDEPSITLADPNAACLQFAAKRIKRYQPQTIQFDVLDPSSIPTRLEASFASIGLNYVLHCLPGSMSDKAVVFEQADRLLRPNGKLFGSTILGSHDNTPGRAKRLMAFYNKKGIFSNRLDDLQSLERNLKKTFSEFSCVSVGSVALFMGKKRSD